MILKIVVSFQIKIKNFKMAWLTFIHEILYHRRITYIKLNRPWKRKVNSSSSFNLKQVNYLWVLSFPTYKMKFGPRWVLRFLKGLNSSDCIKTWKSGLDYFSWIWILVTRKVIKFYKQFYRHTLNPDDDSICSTL